MFQRVGASTDVVRKEMYDFVDKGGRHVALRPEVTASVVRAFIEHRPPVPWKSWYAGSNFRYERPQKGRYREFRQVGIEAIGSADADLDVEVVALGWEFYAAVGVTQVELLLNSLGDGTCRPAYRALLLAYLEEHRSELCEEHQARLEENPLRVLDCKKPACRKIVEGAPKQLDHLCDACQAHFGRVREGLDALGIPYTIDTTAGAGPRLLHPHHLRVHRPGLGLGPERHRRRWPLRRPGGSHGRPVDPGGRLRPRGRPNPAGRRGRRAASGGCRPAGAWTRSWWTSPAARRPVT